MATRTISTRLAIEGESEYKQAVTNINSSLKTMQSELVKVESEYRNNANSMEALEARGKALSNVQEEQRQKVALLGAALANAQAEQKRHADSVADYGEKIASAQKRLDALKNSTGNTTKEQAELNAEIDKYKKAQSEAERYQAAATKGVNNWQQSVNYAQRDLDDLNETVAKNEKSLGEAKASTDQCATSIDKYGKEVKQAGKDSGEFGDKSKNAINTLASALAAAGVAATIREIAQAMKACVDASIEFESAITGVYKTVSGTEQQLAAISGGIKQMATEIPATTTEIAAVAEAAGQLGIATDDVLSFSRVMIDLGESTNLSAEEAATSLAKFANITGTAAADYSRLGSVIVGLGNSFATTEADITEMATRLASAGTLAGMTEAEIMALATAMSSVGIDAEAGGTAMTQTLTAIEKAVAKGGEGLSEFARISGMSAETFSKTWKDSSVTALQGFISGLGALDEAGESATLVLDDLGLSGVRQSNMLKSLALSAENLGGAVTMSNQAWAENTALTDEAAKRYATTESQMKILENSFIGVQVAIGDALSPAFGELAEAGTDAFSWAAKFIEENPWLVQAITGVATALAALAGTVTLIAAATPIIGAFKAALAMLTPGALPVIAIVSAIAGLVVALGTMSAASDDAAKKTRELTRSMDESRAAYEETQDALKSNHDETLGMVAALETLAGAEDKTAAQKAQIAQLVEELNEAVPNLSLAYDEQTDSLNMTADALRNYVEAEAARQLQGEAAARMVELRKEQIALDGAMTTAQVSLGDAQQRYNEITDNGSDVMTNYGGEVQEAALALADARIAVYNLTTQQKENEEETAALEEQYNSYAATLDDATSASSNAADQGEETTKTLEAQARAAGELSEVSLSLAGAKDTLTSALKEQKEAGSLNLDTALKLIDSGYAAALSFDAETGAITLNQAAYIDKTKAMIEDQLATLEAQRTSINAAIDLKREAYAAKEAAIGHLEKAAAARTAKVEAADADMKALKAEAAVNDARIAALKASKDALGSYSYAATTAARSSASTSKKLKTQAEKDLAEFKTQKATIDHERAMADKDDVEAEKRHNSQLLELRDRFLTDAANTDEYRRATEELHKYEVEQAQEAADEQKKINEQKFDDYYKAVKDAESAYKDSVSAMADASREKLAEIQGAYDDLVAKQDAMAQKLSGYGDLFTLDKNSGMHLEDLDKQIDAIKRYDEVLSKLKENGISDSLLNEVVGMGVDDATTYGQKLLDMAGKDDAAWEEYNAKYDEKNKLAIETAEKFYKDQLDTVETQYNAALETSLKELENTSFTSGQNIGQELTDGMRSKIADVEAAARALRDAAIVDMSGLTLKEKTDGSHSGGLSYVPYNGYVAELHQGERVLTADEAKAYIARSMPSQYDVPAPRDNYSEQTARLMQAMAQSKTEPSGQNDRPIRLEAVMTLDGAVVARKTFEYNQRENRLHGKSFTQRG